MDRPNSTLGTVTAVTQKALITGITGQDGSYLTELLLQKGYIVHGLVRRSSTLERSRLSHLYSDKGIYNQRLFLHYADVGDATSIRRIIAQTAPDELYHFAGQSHVGLSFEIPESTCATIATGSLVLLEILRDLASPCRFLHASSREIFGTPAQSPQGEDTPVAPNSPYGAAKAFATQMVRIYRESHRLFCSNVICYNHESPRRGENFVTRKITLAAARIACGLQSEIRLGDLNTARDWGYAQDFVHAMWLMLQQDSPGDFVLATGKSHTLKELLEIAFRRVNLDWKNHVQISDRFLRPADPTSLVGNPQKAETELGWRRSTDFQSLIEMMVDHDLEFVKRNEVS